MSVLVRVRPLPKRGSLAWRFLMLCLHSRDTRMTAQQVAERFHAWGRTPVSTKLRRWTRRGVLARYPEGYGIGRAWL